MRQADRVPEPSGRPEPGVDGNAQPVADATPAREAFEASGVTTWIFDLDNTLYPPEARLLEQIEPRMTAYVMRALDVGPDEADAIRRRYWTEFGSTLTGLMRLHDVDPTPYLTDVHDISLDGVIKAPELRARIRDLPGRRIVFTNSSRRHAERVLDARGLSGIFDAIYDVEDAGFRSKPEREAFETVLDMDRSSASGSAMFEDTPRNLLAPHDMGMRTVHVAPDPVPARHIHHHTNDLGGFLDSLL